MTTVQRLTPSSVEASSLPRQTLMPAFRNLRNGMTPLPIFTFETGLCATEQPEIGHQADIVLVDPDRMDHHRLLVEHAHVVGIAYQRLSELLLAENALQTRFKDVHVEGNVALARDTPQRLEIARRHALRRRA